MTRNPVRLARCTTLGEQERREVEALVLSATEADGVAPVDDAVRMSLQYGAHEGAEQILARIDDDTAVVGYAHIVTSAPGGPTPPADSAHVVVAPPVRRRGVGTALLETLLDSARGELRVWAHGDGRAAQGLAERLGFDRARELWQLHRPLAEPLPEPTLPDDVRLRTFSPGRDDQDWVDVNARAFRDHPEQGRLTLDDLHERMAQDWFDPAGFFLLERAGTLAGFHWTKVHPPVEGAGAATGEVYAVGLDPEAQGHGLGLALTLIGLRHLREAGLPEVMLYVDADNTAAVGLYERLGFERSAVDVMYARQTRPGTAAATASRT